MNLTTMCLACYLKRCHLIAFLTSSWAPREKGKWEEKGNSPPTPLSKSSRVLSKAKSELKKATTWYILVFFQNQWEFLPKSKKQYLKCLKGKGLCQPSSTRLLEMEMRRSWMIGMTCCHYHLRVGELTWYAWPFYPVPEKQHFFMVESV